MTKTHLLGLKLDELQDIAISCGLPKFTGKQIADWIYKKNVTSIDEMTNISLTNREKLSEKYDVGRSAPVSSQISKDGTVKYLFKTDKGHLIESVMIPEKERKTLCVSSQVGCKFNCHFCMTGKQGFSGNLSANEILNQIYSVAEATELTNIVLMGMGEPLDNYIEVKKMIDIMTADYSQAWSPKRITLSTTGVTPKLKLFLEECETHLAISIHSPTSEQRQIIMPAEKAYPIAEVIELLKEYDWSKQRRLSFEYIMFKGFNDSLKEAQLLAKLIGNLDCRVNLIRFHEIPNVDLRTSDMPTIEKFRDFLLSKRVMTTIRASRGEDIFAACGMLSTMEKEKKAKNSKEEN